VNQQMIDQNDFIEEIFPRSTNSTCIAVLGKKQSGKTAFMIYLMEKLHERNLMDRFGSNLPIPEYFKPTFDCDFIEDFETLSKTCKMLNPNPNKRTLKKYFFFGSEMGKWLARDQAWKNVDFIYELQTIRKNGLSFCGDAIDRVDERALNPTHFEGAFIKYNHKNPTVAVYEDWQNGEKTYLTGIPKPKSWFDTFYSAKFYMKPQNPAIQNIALNEDHIIVKKYFETGSWKKANIHPQAGKRALHRFIKYHLDDLASHPISQEENEKTENPVNNDLSDKEETVPSF
jgi:hypothetical protein